MKLAKTTIKLKELDEVGGGRVFDQILVEVDAAVDVFDVGLK